MHGPLLCHTSRTVVAVRTHDGCAVTGISADLVVSTKLPDGVVRFIAQKAAQLLPGGDWWRIIDTVDRKVYVAQDPRTLDNGTVVTEAKLTRPYAAEVAQYFGGERPED